MSPRFNTELFFDLRVEPPQFVLLCGVFKAAQVGNFPLFCHAICFIVA